MERLTRRIEGVVVYVGTKNPYSTGQIPCEVDSAGVREMMYRLAAYEDTWLEPESVEAIKLSMMGKAISEITEFEGLPIDRLRELAEVQGKLVCDPLTVDKPEAIGPEVRRKAREALMEELEAKGLIRYQMLNGVLYAGVQIAAPEKKT